MIKITTSFGGGSNTFAVPITREQVQDAIYQELEDRVRRERLDALRERLRKSAFINPKDPLRPNRSK